MTQDERWKANYDEVMRFVQMNHRNLSKYDMEDRRLHTWCKHNRKQMNQGLLKEDRVEPFKKLLALCEACRRKNQYK